MDENFDPLDYPPGYNYMGLITHPFPPEYKGLSEIGVKESLLTIYKFKKIFTKYLERFEED